MFILVIETTSWIKKHVGYQYHTCARTYSESDYNP